MRLATARDGSRDGRLVIVRRDGEAMLDASRIAPTLQAALDGWAALAPSLRALAASFDGGDERGEPLDACALHAPLPRAYEWVDGSAYLSHVRLVRRARGAEPPAALETEPLVYQAGSGTPLAPADDILLPDPGWGLDFEGEVCAGEGLRLLPVEARDGVLALRGDARRAGSGLARRPRAPAAHRALERRARRRRRRGLRDALLVLRPPRACGPHPRVDFHPDAVPCPYPHASVDLDEVLFYVRGEFTSRRGIGAGSVSHHPAGVMHGPHPGAYEASVGTRPTNELAVMLDCQLPLTPTAEALEIEDPGYQDSFA